ncbi:hypothetical protein A7R75_14460 [Mycolicibacterium llatzerense]|nr:hypothetical protein [Mycolicibacterium llatzerense]
MREHPLNLITGRPRGGARHFVGPQVLGPSVIALHDDCAGRQRLDALVAIERQPAIEGGREIGGGVHALHQPGLGMLDGIMRREPQNPSVAT